MHILSLRQLTMICSLIYQINLNLIIICCEMPGARHKGLLRHLFDTYYLVHVNMYCLLKAFINKNTTYKQ